MSQSRTPGARYVLPPACPRCLAEPPGVLYERPIPPGWTWQHYCGATQFPPALDRDRAAQAEPRPRWALYRPPPAVLTSPFSVPLNGSRLRLRLAIDRWPAQVQLLAAAALLVIGIGMISVGLMWLAG
jgi:hypothetical protein